ncbi:tonB domain protein [Beggiatoa sp. PS]|nr:tonB domain protein [Beggiatoa sp. PS]
MKSGTIDPYTERFAVALFLSAVLHFVIIYGMGFVMPKPGKILNSTMEIILVQKSTKEIPKKADYLAQATHEGGGDAEPKTRPSTPTLAPFPEQTAELVFTPPPPQTAAASLDEPQTEILTTVKSTQHQIEQQTEITPPDEPGEYGNASQNVIFDEYVSENTLFINTSAAKLASIQAELADSFNSYAKRLRHKYISASTKEFKYANYMEAWRRKIEEIGNTNYPNQARRRKLSGSLILDVALNPNGTIRQVEIKESSKYRILDEAALRIVRLAAPFDPFPEHIRKDTDILHITRRWEFRYNSLTTRQ